MSRKQKSEYHCHALHSTSLQWLIKTPPNRSSLLACSAIGLKRCNTRAAAKHSSYPQATTIHLRFTLEDSRSNSDGCYKSFLHTPSPPLPLPDHLHLPTKHTQSVFFACVCSNHVRHGHVLGRAAGCSVCDLLCALTPEDTFLILILQDRHGHDRCPLRACAHGLHQRLLRCVLVLQALHVPRVA